MAKPLAKSNDKQLQNESKKDSKDQETVRSSITPDPEYHVGKIQKYNKHHQQEPRGNKKQMYIKLDETLVSSVIYFSLYQGHTICNQPT